MLQHVLQHINKNSDPYILRVGDFSKAQANWDFQPSAFLNFFIANWEKTRERKNESSQVEFVKKLVTNDQNIAVWEESELFKDQSKFSDSNFVEQEFRDRIRGFSDQELEYKTEHYKDKINRNIEDIEPIIKYLENRLSNLDKKERGKHLYWSTELENLQQIVQKYKDELDESSLASRAATSLMQDRGLFSGISRFIRSFRDIDISPPFLRTALLDLTLDNPYRHLVWIPYPTYTQVQQEWEKNNDKEKCLIILEQYIDIIKNLELFFEAEFVKDRREILLESVKCSKNGNYTAAGLLLFTQTEGILFDIAKEINGKIFNDNELTIFGTTTGTNKYIDRTGNEKDFLSIMNILFDSKMRDFFWPGFLEYFASDFYSQRCIYAHGQNTTMLNEYDYKTISLFTLTVLDIYREFKETGKAPSLSLCYEK